MAKRNDFTREPHPNSIEARAQKDPELARRLKRGRMEADEDLHSIETWVRDGCVSWPDSTD